MSKPSLRVMVSVSEGMRELYDEVARLPSRHRADRIRILAAIGLASLGRNASPPQPADQASSEAGDQSELAASLAGKGGVNRKNVKKLAGSL